MASLRVVNASPLILLGKLGHLALLDEGGREVLAPDAVLKEVGNPTLLGGLRGLGLASLAIGRADDVPVPPEIRRFALDPGESMVLAVALDRQTLGDDVEVVLDERKGRNAAKHLGLVLVGTAGLLLRAKSDGRITEVAPLLDELERQGMYLNQGLRRSILILAGE